MFQRPMPTILTQIRSKNILISFLPVTNFEPLSCCSSNIIQGKNKIYSLVSYTRQRTEIRDMANFQRSCLCNFIVNWLNPNDMYVIPFWGLLEVCLIIPSIFVGNQQSSDHAFLGQVKVFWRLIWFIKIFGSCDKLGIELMNVRMRIKMLTRIKTWTLKPFHRLK